MAPTLEDRIRWYTEDNDDLRVRTLEEDIRESMDFTEEQVMCPLAQKSKHSSIYADWFLSRRNHAKRENCVLAATSQDGERHSRDGTLTMLLLGDKIISALWSCSEPTP